MDKGFIMKPSKEIQQEFIRALGAKDFNTAAFLVRRGVFLDTQVPSIYSNQKALPMLQSVALHVIDDFEQGAARFPYTAAMQMCRYFISKGAHHLNVPFHYQGSIPTTSPEPVLIDLNLYPLHAFALAGELDLVKETLRSFPDFSKTEQIQYAIALARHGKRLVENIAASDQKQLSKISTDNLKQRALAYAQIENILENCYNLVESHSTILWSPSQNKAKL